VDLLEGEARRTGVALTSTATEALPLVRCDADQIQQLVLNLLTNALYATPPGGSISLVLSLVRDVTPPAVRCVVRDTGCGMTDEVRERLFEPFFTTRAAQGGTGLGLAVVRAIVNDHRGSIAVQSLAGSGTTVCVNLPVDGETSSVSTYGAS
jgi:signal transduction histidine kinase